MIVKISSVVFCATALLLSQGCCLRKFLRSPQKLRAQQSAVVNLWRVGMGRLGKTRGGVGVNRGNLGGSGSRDLP